MSDGEGKREYLSVEDMKWWLAQETRDLDKARELRLREANAIVAAYEKGELTPEESTRRRMEYEDRWGEALPGTNSLSDMTDAEIIARIDAADATEQKWSQQYKRETARNLLGVPRRTTER
jgi:hypothetical protein